MSGILRQVTAFGGKVVLGVMLLALLTPPFGLRAYLEARAQEQAQATQVIHSFGRPIASVVKAGRLAHRSMGSRARVPG